jgi:hypothetical protein
MKHLRTNDDKCGAKGRSDEMKTCAMFCGARFDAFQCDYLLKIVQPGLDDRDICKCLAPRIPVMSQKQMDDLLVEGDSKEPPLGLVPRWSRDHERMAEVLAAIDRYYRHKPQMTVPAEWWWELRDLAENFAKRASHRERKEREAKNAD